MPPTIFNPYRYTAGCVWDYCSDWENTDDASDNNAGISIDTATGQFNFERNRNNENWKASIDPLGATLDNTAWVMRVQQTITDNASGGSAFGNWGWAGISDKDYTSGSEVACDQISTLGMFRTNTVAQYRQGYCDGVVMSSSTGSYIGASSEETRYIESIRQSSTSFQIWYFTDSGFSSEDFNYQQTSLPSTVINLRYFFISNWDISSPADNNSIDGYMKTLQIADGVTVAP